MVELCQRVVVQFELVRTSLTDGQSTRRIGHFINATFGHFRPPAALRVDENIALIPNLQERTFNTSIRAIGRLRVLLRINRRRVGGQHDKSQERTLHSRDQRGTTPTWNFVAFNSHDNKEKRSKIFVTSCPMTFDIRRTWKCTLVLPRENRGRLVTWKRRITEYVYHRHIKIFVCLWCIPHTHTHT